jgi:4-amino-4-deoxy-L-arabinose transferase-like glycosyltransferase
MYITAAQEFAGGNFKQGLIIYRMPFYPLLVAITHYVVPHWIVAARGVSILTSVLTIIPLYLLTREFFSPKAAVWGCVAFALSPLPNHLAVEVTRDSTYLFFFAWATYFALVGIESKKLTYFFLVSVFSTLSFLCRLEGVILFFCYTTFLSYIALRKPDERGGILKGILIYISFPVVFLGIGSLMLQMKVAHYTGKTKHFNRISFLANQAKDFIYFRFHENYLSIYKKLEIFETKYRLKRGGLNFAEVARHHMYAIYFIGLLQSFIKALFPPYVVPAVFGLRKSELRKHAFLMFLLVCYLLLLYCSFMKRDVLRERHLLAPAFLVYPWIGVGLDRFVNYFRKGTWKWWLTVVLIIATGLSSIYASVDILWKQDDVVVRAGQWIGKRPALKRAAIITTDRRIPFYAGRDKDYIGYYKRDYLAMEKLALNKSYDLLIIRKSRKAGDKSPRLRQFESVRKFVGVKDIVTIYYSPKLQRTFGIEGRS